jgi:hypothetical protein
MKKNTIITILIILVVIGLFFLLKHANKTQYFNKVTLSEDNYVFNLGEDKYADTIVFVGLNELGIKGCSVTIEEMPQKVKDLFFQQNQMNLQAAVFGENDMYDILTSDLNRSDAILVLSHELIHLKQYRSGRLEYIDDGFVKFDNKVYKVTDIPYNNRPWEVEAFNEQYDLTKRVSKILIP